MGSLEFAWSRCIRDLRGDLPPDSAWQQLKDHYSEPHRAYHTLQHLRECFDWFDQIQSQIPAPGEVAFALFYHDAVYDPRSSDNEERSAELALHVLQTHVHVRTDASRVEDLILATKHDAVPNDIDAQFLVDID